MELCGLGTFFCVHGFPLRESAWHELQTAWGLWWLIAWTGWWPSAGRCKLPVSTWNYEAEGLMGVQVIEPRCLRVRCSRFHRFARLWSLIIIYFSLRYPSPIFTQSWTSQMQRPSPCHTASREAIPEHIPEANSSDTSSLPCGPGSGGQFFFFFAKDMAVSSPCPTLLCSTQLPNCFYTFNCLSVCQGPKEMGWD